MSDTVSAMDGFDVIEPRKSKSGSLSPGHSPRVLKTAPISSLNQGRRGGASSPIPTFVAGGGRGGDGSGGGEARYLGDGVNESDFRNNKEEIGHSLDGGGVGAEGEPAGRASSSSPQASSGLRLTGIDLEISFKFAHQIRSMITQTWHTSRAGT